MFLRSLTIRGFKSFADKTTLEFTPGISVIVGPNGSGKSNISDAIAWVLGEQGAGALRGSQMSDVIFAGSPSRPPLGMAEVRLVLDNEAGLLPIPASEIEISRTLYRSGESEYRLAGRPCRLLDVQELLSDTGVGRALHTLIGQGHLEEVLTARPEDRRQLIEEAAGIAKHRRRRNRAERKLAGLEQDLLRLQDIVGELRRQLKPLKQQAEIAERHEVLTQEAGALAAKLAAVRLRDLYRDRERRDPAWREAEARQGEVRRRLGELDSEIELADAERSGAESAAHLAEEAHAQAATRKSEAEAVLRLALRKEAEARERLSSAANRSARLFAVEDELARTEGALGEVDEGLRTRSVELGEAERAFGRLEQQRRDAEEERRRLDATSAFRRAEVESLRRSLAGHDAERARLSALRRELRQRHRAAVARIEELRRQVEALDATGAPLAAAQAGLERERSELALSLIELEGEEKGLLARQEVVDARRAELSESPGAAFLRRRGDAAIGVLHDLIGAPPHLAVAVRAALGPLADAVVYGSQEDALRGAAQDLAAGVTLLSATPPAELRVSGSAPVPGVGPLLRSVRPDPRVAGLVARLLEGIYLVQNLAEAAARSRAHPSGQFVTMDGLVVGPSFVRTAAGADVRLKRVRRESAALERELASVRRRLREARRRQGEVLEELSGIGRKLEETDGLITTAADELARTEAERAAVGREESLLDERLAVLDAARRDIDERLTAAPSPIVPSPELPPMPEPPVRLRIEVEALRRERTRLEAGVLRARQEIAALAADDPIALREALREAEAARTAAEAELVSAEKSLAQAVETHHSAAEAARIARERHARANRAWRESATEVDRLRRESEEEDRARLDLERRIGEAERVVAEGHGMRPEDAVASLGEEDSVESLQRRSDLVVRRLGLLGRVNLLAVGELQALQDRHDFMVRELDDVRGARRDLQDVIADVDRRIAELFEAAFRDVAAAFSGLFATLFPGGEGRLTLTDPDDPLGAGIEVEARPGGKRVKRLSLLSGGERSLAALALLFAVFRARPSPFYLMDEVEAALDDVNLSRFLEAAKGFAATSQILIVTHQKRTMETADVLYGVAMRGDGASTVISQRLAEVPAV